MDPLVLFLEWYRDAERAGVPQPDAMMLATSTPNGRPSLRTVLYRPGADGGIRFFTSYEGRKGRELAANPHAAVLFYWEPLGRQVRAEGVVRRASAEESDAYFASRPRGSQLAAWASPQSRPIKDMAALHERYHQIADLYAGRPVPRPPHWGGFRLDAHRWELWRSGEHRLHERVEYVREDAGWVKQLLGP